MTFDEKLAATERLAGCKTKWWKLDDPVFWACSNDGLEMSGNGFLRSDWGCGQTPEEALDRYWDLLMAARSVRVGGLYGSDYTWDSEKREWRAVIRQRVRVRV